MKYICLILNSEETKYLLIISKGRNQPQVSWFMNGILVDEEYEHSSGNIIENRLLWPSLQRHDLYSVFMCRASNTKAVAPKERRLVLDMYCEYPYFVFMFNVLISNFNEC